MYFLNELNCKSSSFTWIGIIYLDIFLNKRQCHNFIFNEYCSFNLIKIVQGQWLEIIRKKLSWFWLDTKVILNETKIDKEQLQYAFPNTVWTNHTRDQLFFISGSMWISMFICYNGRRMRTSNWEWERVHTNQLSSSSWSDVEKQRKEVLRYFHQALLRNKF